MSGSYSHVPSREHLELKESPRPAGAAAPQQPGQAEDDLLDMYRSRDDPDHFPDDPSNQYLNRSGSKFGASTAKTNKGRIVKIALLVGAIAAIGIAVALTLVFTVGKKKGGSSSADAASPSASVGPNGGIGSSGTSGKTGSLITLEDGSTFTYNNDFGGEWLADPKKPFDSGGKAQSWSPRVSEEWVWGEHVIHGVNLGGWLVTEPFIVPGLYEKYLTNDKNVQVVDEWTLSLAMGGKLAEEMENHYKTFITEKDFADIAAAGLNWVRIPIGFWAIETINDEPFLVGTAWTYFLKAIQWGRKYGIRIYLDLHALPGSQNAWNHSGKSGSVNFMHGVMGLANAQRTLTYLRILTQFVSQPQYKDVVQIVGIVNEILWATIGQEAVQSFYYAAYETMRKSSGTGAGNGPYIAIHEGFQGPAIWEGFLAGSDRVALDQHPYLAFMGDTESTPASSAQKPCDWAIATNQSQKVFGVTVGGEWSTAINNCGLWLNGMDAVDPPACAAWEDWSSWDQTVIDGLKQVALASMDALQNFFFWTWKIGNSTTHKTSTSPMWHYQLGLERGWIPKDPREASGHCASVLGSSQLFDGAHPATATGGVGAGTLDPVVAASHPFPPATISPSFSGTQLTLLPTYTPTGSLKTLPVPTFTTAPSVSVGTGWNNANDNELGYVPVAGCSYPDAWDAVSAALPAATCTGA
ncbi:glycoside hydrolase [Coprinellus micaceus]|uniref:glucan 1,3-beta-glucosidase n=1 Tax=Coprinellus micaceus TaxID=71717 RepID=A0A4Y7U0X7_COPMI|nr:glycoside hydrolase [Coprinellus micaceus]